MERSWMLQSYGKYLEVITKLSGYPLLRSPSVAELFENKSLMQRIYKEQRAAKFEGFLQEYVCWISTCYLIDALKRTMPPDAPMVDWMVAFIENYTVSRADVRNVLRLFRENPRFYLLVKSEITQTPAEPEQPDNLVWGSTFQLKERMLCKMTLAGFLELVIFEDKHGKMREDFDELVGFIKDVAKIGQNSAERPLNQ